MGKGEGGGGVVVGVSREYKYAHNGSKFVTARLDHNGVDALTALRAYNSRRCPAEPKALAIRDVGPRVLV